jgi:transposase
VDSSGLRSHGRSAWFSLVLGKESRRDFRKMHLAVECHGSARFVYAWALTEGSEADSPHFTTLLEETVSHGRLGYVCADSAYASRVNAQTTEDLGGTPYIRPKADHTPRPGGSPAWKRMVSHAICRPRSFERHSHRRWICETVNSVIKRKWGETLKNRTLPSQARELGFRVLLHNAREWLKKDLALSAKSSSAGPALS